MQLTIILVAINTIVFFVLSFGGMTENIYYMLEKYDALVIESFGVGGLPTYKDNIFNENIKHIHQLLENG